uniref:Uncharacterized protein n=1 Tax=Oryza sativa subsp. japonica TaxID=39947 RepID=Q69KT2_ORYSJ|nr:hypothetical protein [Oryza sativa Japonica Group]BAD36477.1 hypothetical protein [Oryza sativa Japonica Group]
MSAAGMLGARSRAPVDEVAFPSLQWTKHDGVKRGFSRRGKKSMERKRVDVERGLTSMEAFIFFTAGDEFLGDGSVWLMVIPIGK